MLFRRRRRRRRNSPPPAAAALFSLTRAHASTLYLTQTATGFTDSNKGWLKPARRPTKAPSPPSEEDEEDDGADGMDGPPLSDDDSGASLSSDKPSDLSGSDSDGECWHLDVERAGSAISN